MDKLAKWDELRFDVIFHGDDWKNSDLYNKIEQQLKEKNIDMVFLPHTAGVSSTHISREINK